MRFFIPERLIRLEYLSGGKADPQYNRLAKDYQNEIDFAFFVVNFNYSKADYEALTPAEKLFIRKAYEEKVVSETSSFKEAVQVAVYNCLRKKGKRPVELWKKVQRPADKEVVQEQIRIVEEMEKRNGKSWVDAIYKAAGRKKPVKKPLNVQKTRVPVQTYIGNPRTMKFHRLACSKRPNPENRVVFNSKEDALKGGYQPCSYCNP